MPEETKKPEINEIATAAKDIDIFAGWLKRLENPDPVLSTESGGKGIRLYDEAARDAHVASVLQTRILTVVGKEWRIDPARKEEAKGRKGEKAKTKEEEVAEFVKKTILACNFDQARQEILKAILYGFYCAEVMWGYEEEGERGKGEKGKTKNGRIFIKKILAKHPRRFVFTPERELRLLTPASMIDGEQVPDRKFIVFTYGSSDNPYGEGLGQKLWWPVWFKKNGIKFWVTFAEKFGSPTAVGKYPPGTVKDDQDKLHAAIEAIQQETGVTIPEGMVIELLEATRTSSINTYEALCNYMDSQISKAILGHTAAADATPGKLGNEQQSVDIREDIVKADADALCECLNNTLVRWIVDYNFGPQEEYPKIWIRTEPEKDLKALAERDRILVKEIGVPVGKKYFYENYNLPEPEEGEELVSPPAAPSPFPALSERGRSFAEVSGNMEVSMEARRQKLVSQYLTAMKNGISGVREDALREIEDLLLKGAVISEAEFTSGVYGILSKHYRGVSLEEIEKAITPIYSFYRLSDKSAWAGPLPAIGILFDMVDRGAVEALAKIDRYYLSKWIDNQDMQGPVMKFLQEKYLEQGEALFGRGSGEAIAAFRGQFADKLSGLEDWQIRRIVDTSVTRMRTLGDVRQAVLANAELRVHVTRGEMACDICQPHHGEVVNAGRMETRMLTAAKDPENFGIFDEVPPYHPNCVCRLIMSLE